MDRRLRLLIVGLLASASLAVVLITDPPASLVPVDEVAASPDRYTDETHPIHGIIANGSIDTTDSTFELAGADHALPVDFGGVAVGDGFSEGRTVLVYGHLEQRDGMWWVQAESIDIGCPSKYEAEEAHPEGIPQGA